MKTTMKKVAKIIVLAAIAAAAILAAFVAGRTTAPEPKPVRQLVHVAEARPTDVSFEVRNRIGAKPGVYVQDSGRLSDGTDCAVARVTEETITVSMPYTWKMSDLVMPIPSAATEEHPDAAEDWAAAVFGWKNGLVTFVAP